MWWRDGLRLAAQTAATCNRGAASNTATVEAEGDDNAGTGMATTGRMASGLRARESRAAPKSNDITVQPAAGGFHSNGLRDFHHGIASIFADLWE